MKLSHILRYRSCTSDKLLPGKFSTSTKTLWAHNFASEAVSAGINSSKIFADYTLFKGKAALAAKPILPTFNSSESYSRCEKKGVILLTFWPAISERKYDWEKRQVFALSPTELGSLISLEPGKSCEFFHDPSMKSSNAGQIRKSLSVTPLGDNAGYFFNLSVVNSNLNSNERFSVPVSKAEYTVMRTAFSYILPHIMGWDHYTKQVPASSGLNPVKQQEMRVSPNFEWNK